MNQARSFSRRYVLASSTAIISAGALIAAPSATLAKQAELEDLAAANVASDVVAPASIAGLSDKLKKLKKGKEGRNGATLRDFDRNPFLKPVLKPLSNAEQNDYKRAVTASGQGI